MRRIVLLVALAAMMAAAMALSGVAQAKPITTTKADKACLAEAAKTLKASFNPDATFNGGTEERDDFDVFRPTAGPEVFCGFGGDDVLFAVTPGDIFLGGAGNDYIVNTEVTGTFYGGAGDDVVDGYNRGTFYGGDGIDTVHVGNPPVDGP